MTTLRLPVKRDRFKVLVPGFQIDLVPDGSRSTGKDIEQLFQAIPAVVRQLRTVAALVLKRSIA